MGKSRDEIDVEGLRILRDTYTQLLQFVERHPDASALVEPLQLKIKEELVAKDWNFLIDVAKVDKSFLTFPNFNRLQVVEIKEDEVIVRSEHSGNELSFPHHALVSESDIQALIKSAKQRKRDAKASVSRRKKALKEKRQQRKDRENSPTARMLRNLPPIEEILEKENDEE